MSIDVPIPFTSRWERRSARFVLDRQERPPRPEDGIVTAFRDGAVTLRTKRRTEGFTNALQETGYQGIRTGDLVIHGMDAFAGTVGVSDSDGKASPVVHAYRGRPGVDVRYYSYLLRELARSGFILSLAKGIRERSTAFDPQTFRSLALPHPPPEEQRAIADFLDRETARIDGLISKKHSLRRALVDRLAAERTTLLVDRGDVTAIPLMHLTDRARPIVYGIVQAGPHDPDGVPYIKTGDLMGLDPAKLSRTSLEIHNRYRRAAVYPGDIVIAMRASIGLSVVVPDSLPVANLTQGTARIASARDVNPEWLFRVLQTQFVQQQCDVRAVGTTFRTLNIWDLRRLRIPTPPRNVQDSLARRMTEVEVTFRELQLALDVQMRVLQEHRQALITGAVTGQLVRRAA